MSVLTDVEKIILQNVDSNYIYITRDMNGDLYVYPTLPEKCATIWSCDDGNVEMIAFKHLFKDVSWKDEEPTLISDLLNSENEVVKFDHTMFLKLRYWEHILGCTKINGSKIVKEEISKVLKNYVEVE